MARPISYASAIKWIIENDDTAWLDDENGSLSVSAALVADIYSKTDQDVIADLRKAAHRAAKEAA